MDERRVNDALEYAVSSNRIEDLNITKDELERIKKEILSGNGDDSFLYSVVKKIMKYNGELTEDEKKDGKIRKWTV